MGVSSTNRQTSLQPRIYVACLAAYNNGHLHGAWLDASADEWAMWEGIAKMLACSPIPHAEEWAVHDYEGFGGVRIGEYTGLGRIAEITGFLAEHGELGAAVLDHFSGDIEEAREALEQRYLGCHASLADHVQELTEESAVIPQALRYYIDWQAMARDAELNGDLFTIETGYQSVHVFAGH
jgi:antirestriction protein